MIKKMTALSLVCIVSLFIFSACSNPKSPSNAQQFHDFRIVEEAISDELYGIAVRKEDTVLRDEIQNALNQAIKDGSAAKVAKKWFGKDTIYKPEYSTIQTDPNAKSDKDTIILGCDIDFAPMSFMDGDEIVGFDIDLAKLIIEKKMGKKLQVEPIIWADKEKELNKKQIDVLWNGLTITDQRMEEMCFTEPYMHNRQVIVVPKNSNIRTPEQMKDKRVAMQKESTAMDAFIDYDIPATVTELESNVDCLMELSQGLQDLVIMDSVVAEYYLSLTK